MKEIILVNGFRVQLDDADYEWASQHSWFMFQRDNTVSIGRVDNDGNTIKLVRDISVRLLGKDVVDNHARVYNSDKNFLNCRRNNIRIKKYFQLPDAEK